jgi:hypothetical protein
MAVPARAAPAGAVYRGWSPRTFCYVTSTFLLRYRLKEVVGPGVQSQVQPMLPPHLEALINVFVLPRCVAKRPGAVNFDDALGGP